MPSVTFTATGSTQSWQAPAGVEGIFVTLQGAKGANHTGKYRVGNVLVDSTPSQGGFGARVSGAIAVTPGETLTVAPGMTGLDPAVRAPNGLSDYRGGNPGGGAASVLLRGVTPLAIAAGGGGAGASGPGGDGGGTTGQTGSGNPAGNGTGGGLDPNYITGDGGTGSNTIDGRAGGGGGGLVGGGSGAFLVASFTRDNPFGDPIFTPGIVGGGGGGSSLVPTGGRVETARDGATIGSVTIAWNVAPLAPEVLTPVADAAAPRDVPARVSWRFVAALPGDRQTAAQVEVSRSGTVLRYQNVVGDSTFVDVSSDDVSGAAAVRVRTAGNGGDYGPWSSLRAFTFVDRPPAPVITAPANGTVVPGSSTVLQWTQSAQTAYQVRRATTPAQDATTLGLGDVVVDAAARQATIVFPSGGHGEYIGVRTRDGNGVWSVWASVYISLEWNRPQGQRVTASPRPDLGGMTFTYAPIVEAGRSAAAAVRLVAYSKVDGVETVVLDGDTWYTPRSGVEYLFAAVAVSALGTTTTVVTADNEGLRWGEGQWGESEWVL